jgi:hypothetical protein
MLLCSSGPFLLSPPRLLPFTMNHQSATQKETTFLITRHEYRKPTPKFPLGLVSEAYRPYLELIRLEKASPSVLAEHSTDRFCSPPAQS